MLVWAAVGWACRGHLPEVKLNCLTLPTPPSPSTGVGAGDDVRGDLGGQCVPVHHGGAEQARRGHRRRDLEGPAVGGGHYFSDRLID